MFRNFPRMVKDTMGQLEPIIYKKIYEYISTTGKGDIIEHGTAFGTMSIAIAWGIQDSGFPNRKLITVERYDGPSRKRFGSVKELIRKARNNFKFYNVQDYIIQVHRKLSQGNEVADRIKEDEKCIMKNTKGMLSTVVIDCDGHLYRDFEIYLKHLKPGGYIIIDDYGPWYRVRKEKLAQPLILQKAIFTWIQVNHMIDIGAFKLLYRRKDTVFCSLRPDFDIAKYNMEELKSKVDALRTNLKECVKSNFKKEPAESQIVRGKDKKGEYIHIIRH